MWTLYLVCLVVGGLLLVLSLFADGDAGDGLETDLDVDAGELDVDAGELDADGGGEGLGAAARFLSVRNFVFFTAFFGLTGTLLSLVRSAALVTLGTALAMGALAAFGVSRLMRYLRQTESGALPGLRALEGATARVVVDVARDRAGKIAVTGGDRTVQLVARLHEDAAAQRLGAGETVLVVRMENGTAWIAEPTFLG